jgi:hypothetical protein
MFIEVSEGISINIDSIQEVEATPTGVIIHTPRGSYPSAFPYRLLLSIIMDKEEVEPQTVKLEQPAMNALNSLGHHFAG